jgi:catechol 2,3-dioxygenase-like lactoylglutathione lyase family enzyme
MVDFVREVLGLRVNFQEPTTVEFSTSEGDQIQLMAPADPYYDFFTQHAAGPVPLFEVDDVHLARCELETAGIEVIGATGRDSRWEWIHFRAPDGNLYELASRLPDAT